MARARSKKPIASRSDPGPAPPPARLLAAVGIQQPGADQPGGPLAPPLLQQRPDPARGQQAVGVQEQQVLSPRPARAEVAGPGEADVALPLHQRQARLGPGQRLLHAFPGAAQGPHGLVELTDVEEKGDQVFERERLVEHEAAAKVDQADLAETGAARMQRLVDIVEAEAVPWRDRSLLAQAPEPTEGWTAGYPGNPG